MRTVILNLAIVVVNDVWTSTHAAAEIWKDNGNSAFSSGNYKVAIDLYTNGIKLAMSIPKNERQIVALLTNRAQAYSKENFVPNALEDITLSLQIDPTWAKVVCLL